jgi:hypothetical protein
VDLRIDAKIPEALERLDDFRYRQVPFALSVALNRVGKAGKEAALEHIFRTFTIRGPAFIKRSVVQRASSKRDLRTTLTVRDAFLAQHEQGGTRRPGDVGRGIVQPVGRAQRARGVIRGANTPAAALKRRHTHHSVDNTATTSPRY